MTAAVLLVGLQNDYAHPAGANSRVRDLRVPDLEALVAAVNRLTALARANGWPVFWSQVSWADEDASGLLGRRRPHLRQALRTGTWGAALLDDLVVLESDRRIQATRFSAFHGTSLVTQLAGTERLYVGGVGTDYLVESTVRDAFQHDLDVIVVADAVQGYSDRAHHRALEAMSSVFATILNSPDLA
ncbi:MAG: cysteine hydrolase [Nocardioidaceae bacterium]|nr:cysteine hydrolase [Nocardioidaceae bacterium]